MTRRLATAIAAGGLTGLAALTISGAGYPSAPDRCTADELNLAVGEVVSLSREATAPIQITAKPGVRCTLNGYATDYLFADAAGNPIDGSPGGGSRPTEPVVVSPGSPAHIQVQWLWYAAEAPAPATLSFTLPGAPAPSTVAWPSEGKLTTYELTHTPIKPGLSD